MKIIAHRGASVAKPENTPAAFSAADEMGADGVELDLRIAPAGRNVDRLVIFHDQLPTHQCQIERLPGFDDVLDACGQRMLINVEIKNGPFDGGFDPTMAVVSPTIDVMRARGSTWSQRWLISSFSIETIDHCRLVAPEMPTAYLTSHADEAAIEAALIGGHAAIHPWERHLTEQQVTACRDAGLAVNIWTCNDPGRLRQLRAIGVDGACTDVPDIALDAFGRNADSPDPTPRWF